MLQLERQKHILKYLEENRKATTNELSEMLGVSATTIRTDLNQMDKEKLLTKTHGGAVYRDNSTDQKELTGFTELTVITNGINLALALKDVPGITVILTGGIVTSASSSIEGLLGEDLLKKIHTDIAFVSARGFSVENGLTDFSIYEADLKRMCIKASAKTIALIDHTKFDTSSISSYASIDDLHLVITDAGLSQNTKEIYEKAGIDLIVAE